MDLAKLYAEQDEDALDGQIAVLKRMNARQKKVQESSAQEQRDSPAIATPAKKRTPSTKRPSKIAKKNLPAVDITEKYQGKGITITRCGPSKGRKRSS